MLEEVLALFCRRYGLSGPDDSRGCRAIQGAIRGEVTIPQLRRVLTEDYELYPQYEGRVMAILDEIEASAAPKVHVDDTFEDIGATEVESSDEAAESVAPVTEAAAPSKAGRKKK